jgi:histone H3/H4
MISVTQGLKIRNTDLRFQAAALQCLQEAAEAYIVSYYLSRLL